MLRRSFLIGAGVILTAPFVVKLRTAIAENLPPEALIAEETASDTLYALPNASGRGHYLTFKPNPSPWPAMTYRDCFEDLPEAFGSYHSYSLSDEELAAEHGITAEELDDLAPEEYYMDAWVDKFGPRRAAFDFLDELDLGPEDEDGEGCPKCARTSTASSQQLLRECFT